MRTSGTENTSLWYTTRLYKVGAPIKSRPVLWVIHTNKCESVELLGHLMIRQNGLETADSNIIMTTDDTTLHLQLFSSGIFATQNSLSPTVQ